MPAPATLTAAAGLPVPVVHAVQAGKLTAGVTRAAGMTTTVTDTAAAVTSVT